MMAGARDPRSSGALAGPLALSAIWALGALAGCLEARNLAPGPLASRESEPPAPASTAAPSDPPPEEPARPRIGPCADVPAATLTPLGVRPRDAKRGEVEFQRGRDLTEKGDHAAAREAY